MHGDEKGEGGGKGNEQNSLKFILVTIFLYGSLDNPPGTYQNIKTRKNPVIPARAPI
jgi:hypothetical protein